jgi:hypothetical protein
MEFRNREEQAVAALKTARELLEQGSDAPAARAASEAISDAKTIHTRCAALTALAWARLGMGYPESAKAALDRIDPPHELDLYCYAAVQAACGNTRLAIQALEDSRSSRSLCCAGAKLLVDLYVRQNRLDRAVAAAIQTRRVLGADNCRIVLLAAREAGALTPAAALALSTISDKPSIDGISAPQP